MKSPPPIAINAAIILKKKSVHADHSGVCDIFSAERKKRGRGPFHPVQYVQKSVLNLYMIRKKMHLLQSKRRKSPCYAQYLALPQVKHVTLIFVSITSKGTGDHITEEVFEHNRWNVPKLDVSAFLSKCVLYISLKFTENIVRIYVFSGDENSPFF